VDTPTRILYDK
jgi:alpha-tubulin suppressor-like RCC1 family protein